MTAAQERKFVLDTLKKLQASVDKLQKSVDQTNKSMKLGGSTMKAMDRAIKNIGKAVGELSTPDLVREEVLDGPNSAVDAYEDDEDEPLSGSVNVGNKKLSMKRGANQFNPDDYSGAVSDADKKVYDAIDDSKKAPAKANKRKKFKKKEVYCEDCDQRVLVHPSTHLSIIEDDAGNQSKVYSCPEHKVGTCQNSRKRKR